MGAWMWAPALLPVADTPTDKGNTQANLSVYTHAPKTHTNTKQQGGILIHVFYVNMFIVCCMYVSGLWKISFV